ncbi:hypothetical protein M8037_13120, partial [Sinorhizobium meliloti]|nr:hypothetical protein [Sinorhizobium meliloti]
MDDREELDRLLGESERPTLTPDGQWRADYRKAQRQRRIASVQPDMFGAPATEHFHRNPNPPKAEDWPLDYKITRFHDLSPEEQARYCQVVCLWFRGGEAGGVSSNHFCSKIGP